MFVYHVVRLGTQISYDIIYFKIYNNNNGAKLLKITHYYLNY